ncbi:MAG TPA: tRNA pseudouridine(38-40) synthase TruA [Candidatus Eisenbergiella merdipullorum]|uniref:tRNA pseudouridine synthase A n=1 Tax=Candidatus Eisenbergiella merdipullorum TaxID=2838553 RepID=A0A9D2I916_9FIRM|nr:tRNA pseudouridine(38-40) synthase TruA [Candidatus Eisenbergiella merdipullorum]
MRRIMLTVAYDGTNYHGWQRQPDKNSIEDVLDHCLSDLTKEPVRVIGASRTDAGVHALGNVAVFDTQARMEADKFAYALNQRLPEDIRIRASGEVPPDFHPRKTDSVKTYEYRILNEEFPDPLERLYSYFCYVPLDEHLMQRAADCLVGEHDFQSFCSAGAQVESTVRTLYSCTVHRERTRLTIRIRGNGFLYNMVRIITGTLMEAGRGKYPPEAVREILEAKDRRAAGPTAPARGLTLVSYEFPALEQAGRL